MPHCPACAQASRTVPHDIGQNTQSIPTAPGMIRAFDHVILTPGFTLRPSIYHSPIDFLLNASLK